MRSPEARNTKPPNPLCHRGSRRGPCAGEFRSAESNPAEREREHQPVCEDRGIGEIGWSRTLDPWGRACRYLRFDGLQWLLRARVDRFDIPINSTYDLYSVGRDGRSALSLQLPASRDDVIRANDGAYVGPGGEF